MPPMTEQQVADWLRSQGIAEGVIADEAGYVAEKYADPDEDPMAVLNASLESYRARSDSQRTGDGDPDGTRIDHDPPPRPVGDPNPGNNRSGTPTDGGAQVTADQLQQLMDAYHQTNSGQGFDVPTPAALPTFTVPGENLSPEIDASLMTLMRGEHTPMQEEIRQLVSRALAPAPLEDEISGALSSMLNSEANDTRLKKRILNARERMETAAVGALESLRARLADRGLVSLPGAPQGIEAGDTSRTFRRVSEPFAAEVGAAITRESELADARELAAVQAATGWSEGRTRAVIDALGTVAGWSANQSTLMLQAAQSATERQQMLSEVALGALDRNMAWNKFLAEFGLERERVQAEIRRGDQQAMYLMLQLYLNWANGVRGGFV